MSVACATNGAMSGSVILLQQEVELMSVAHVTTKSHMNACLSVLLPKAVLLWAGLPQVLVFMVCPLKPC